MNLSELQQIMDELGISKGFDVKRLRGSWNYTRDGTNWSTFYGAIQGIKENRVRRNTEELCELLEKRFDLKFKYKRGYGESSVFSKACDEYYLELMPIVGEGEISVRLDTPTSEIGASNNKRRNEYADHEDVPILGEGAHQGHAHGDAGEAGQVAGGRARPEGVPGALAGRARVPHDGDHARGVDGGNRGGRIMIYRSQMLRDFLSLAKTDPELQGYKFSAHVLWVPNDGPPVQSVCLFIEPKGMVADAFLSLLRLSENLCSDSGRTVTSVIKEDDPGCNHVIYTVTLSSGCKYQLNFVLMN
jgi:hypothetical protein